MGVHISSPPCYLNSAVSSLSFKGHWACAYWQELLQLWQSRCCSLVLQRSLALQESFKGEEWQLVSIAVEFCVMVTLVPIPLKWEWVSYLSHLWGGRWCETALEGVRNWGNTISSSSKVLRNEEPKIVVFGITYCKTHQESACLLNVLC